MQNTIFAVLAGIYTLFRHLLPNLYLASVIKILPILLLVNSLNSVKSSVKSTQKYILCVRAALIFSAIGDIFLVWIHPSRPNALFWGIVFFAAVSL